MRDSFMIAAILAGAIVFFPACSGSTAGPRYDPSPIAMAMADDPGKALISGKDIKEVAFEADPMAKGSYRMRIRLTVEATAAFARLTEDNVGKKLILLLDGEEIMSAVIMEKITKGEIVATTGGQAKTEAIKAKLRKRMEK
jgi:preprotein translocase subunit SecD